MRHRIYISELIRRWNDHFRGNSPKMTMVSLGELMWPDEKRAKLVKRNRLHRLNSGVTKGIRICDATKLCVYLNCDYNQLFGHN